MASNISILCELQEQLIEILKINNLLINKVNKQEELINNLPK